MRRLLLLLCAGTMTAGVALAPTVRTSPVSVEARQPVTPFPAVWHASGDPAVVSWAAGERQRRDWWNAVATWNAVAAWNAAAARTALLSSPPRRHYAARSPARSAATSSEPGTGRCGGDLPPCSVMMCESGGSLTAENPRSTASGKWQILDSTWNGYGGYSHAADAPESVQDGRAREVYAGGAGRQAWVC